MFRLKANAIRQICYENIILNTARIVKTICLKSSNFRKSTNLQGSTRRILYKLPNLINMIDLSHPARCLILHLTRSFYRPVVLFCISAFQAIFTAFRSQCGRIAAALHCTIRLDTVHKLHYNVHEFQERKNRL